MTPNLKLVVNVQLAPMPAHNVTVQNLILNRQLASGVDKKQATSYTMIVLVLLAHITGLIWLVNAKPTLPVIKEVSTMTVSLIANPAPTPEVVPLVPTPPKPVVKKQPVVKQKTPTPTPVIPEPAAVDPVPVAEPTPAPQVVAAKTPEVVEKPAPKVEPQAEPVIEPPKFGAAYLHNPAPAYPSMSRRSGEQGRVLLKVLVSTNGEADTVQLDKSSGFDRLDQAAIEAVKKWQFIPAKRNNQPLSAFVLVPVKFSLN